MGLLERDGELATVASRARAAHAGSGSMVLVCGEPGSGKTSFIDEVLPTLADRFRVLSAACDPLSTPRPLGPIRDLGARLGARTDVALRDSEHSHDIFSAAFDDLASEPSVLIVDDLHWSDQGTVDLLRFVLRRIASAPVLVVGALRDEELDLSHPGRGLLGDVARSPVAETIRLAPLSIVAIEALAEDRDVDATTLHQLTGGNPFFVVEMLGHSDGDLPTTVRDAILARTTGIGPSAWDLLNLLTAAPEAIPDRLLPALGIALPALRELDAAGLIQRGARGVDFRHDLCRLAIGSVVPPGAPPALHQRMLSAIEAGPKPDPAVLVHHAIGAGDADRVLRYADDAGRAAARAGAHAEAATFLRLALAEGDDLPEASRADLLERLAAECYLIDQLSDAIDAAREALDLRIATGDLVAASVGHNALSVYEWYNANREGATVHVERALATLDGAPLSDTDATVTLGHALAMQAFLALQATDVDAADGPLARATELARATADVGLLARTGIVGGMRSVIAGDRDGRGAILSVLAGAPERLDEVHSSRYSNLSYLDVEQRRLDDADDLLSHSIPLMDEHDLPVCRVWQVGLRGRSELMSGSWDGAVADADAVLDGESAPLARTWPHIIRGLICLRRTGVPSGDLELGWELACRYGEPIRQLPAAAALAEQAWLTGDADQRVGEWMTLLDESPRTGLEWSRGELAVWLRRLGLDPVATDVAPPYAALLAGDVDAAIAAFEQARLPYDAALAAFDTDRPDLTRAALDALDRLGADATAAKLRLELRAAGSTSVPSRRRAATRANPAGLTARQLEVLGALSDGSTNAELAAHLFLSEKTVDHHVSAILAKLAVPNRREAVRRARELGLIA